MELKSNMNPYRELGKRAEPACIHYLTSKYVVWYSLYSYWMCQVCGEIITLW